jgi:hypothetical protein
MLWRITGNDILLFQQNNLQARPLKKKSTSTSTNENFLNTSVIADGLQHQLEQSI